MNQVMFLKNVSMLGGFLLLMAFGPGPVQRRQVLARNGCRSTKRTRGCCGACSSSRCVAISRRSRIQPDRHRAVR